MSTFSNLHARSNGGIVILTANATINDSNFVNCTSISNGSGIYADDSYLVMNNTILQDMNAESGAAIFALNDADIHISHSQFIKCRSTTGGLIDL